MNSSDQFTSRLTTILTLIGVAVGLGNVWRFPYMMGSYGGSAFLAVYLVFTFMFAIPALMAEMAFGRASRGGTLIAFTNAFGGRWGRMIGYLLLIGVLIAGSYYAVVVANVFFTAGFSIFFGFEAGRSAGFNSYLANGWLQYALNLILIAGALFVVQRGLQRGIEWVSRAVVPFFLVTILGLIFYSLSLPGAVIRLMDFLRPDFGALTSTQLFAALGQSFFSVGLGGTFMLVYGSYIKENESIPKIAIFTCFGDVGHRFWRVCFWFPPF